ncbi:MAG: N-formylglutamate amidohydrolase [Deltaproteobacteria bacterium]|nr:N-formylglutamate amidohydrolase [Deltaproteobacteria bacterium]
MATVALNVPYGGIFTPPAVEKRLGLTREELGWENFRLADPLLLSVVDAAARARPLPSALGEKTFKPKPLLSYAFSPLVSDPLGFLAADLAGERENAPGPRFIRQGTLGKTFPEWSPAEAELIEKKSSRPYLDAIRDKCQSLLETESLVLLLTARSYPSKPWNHETERRYPRPQASVGAWDERHSPPGLLSFIGRTLRAFNLWPELNWPRQGAYLPPELGDSPRLLAASLSFRRDLFMDENSGRANASSQSLARVLRNVLVLLEDELEEVIRIRHRRRNPPKPPSMVIKAGQGAPA